MRNDLILIALFCLLLLLMLPAASGKIMIDLPLLPRQQLPIDIPFLENISVGGMASSYNDDLHDGTGVLYGDLIVGKGRVVSLKNYSLFFHCYYDGQYKIDVRNGGILMIDNSSISSPNGAFLFQVEKGGMLSLKNSSLSGCGFSSPDIRSNGLWLGSAGNSLIANNISHNYYGVIVDGGQSDIINNTITSNYCGLRIGPAVAVVENNSICFNRIGIDASAAGPGEINGNNISQNAIYGLLLEGSSPKKVSGNDISGNGEGMIVRNATNCVISDSRLGGNKGRGLILENARTVVVRNTTMTANTWGLYMNATNESSVLESFAIDNKFDGVFVNNSRNVAFIGNNASFNDGFGFNILANNTNVVADRRRNEATGNLRGDFNVPQAALSITEVSLVSLLIALVDKLIFVVDLQKVLLTNVFSGIVNPMRDPLSKELDRISNRLWAMFHIKSNGYSRAHVSSHMNVLFFHLINGKDIRGVVRSPVPGKLSSHEIVLQQVRFFDLLSRDRVMLLRNILYMAIMMGAGIVVYTAQVWIGTYDLPYFLPLALQFLVMFPIGLVVQGNVVGHVEKLDYDIRDEASADLLRQDVLRRMAALEEQYAHKAITPKKYGAEKKMLSDALKAVDHMGVRRNYLLFTPEGLTKAVTGFETLLEKSPDEPIFLAGLAEAHAMFGRSLEQNGEDGKGHYEKAMAAARKAYSIDGGRFEVRRALAMALLFNGEPEKAAIELAEALRLHPADAESYLLKAMMEKNADKRRQLYNKAISLNRDLRAVAINAQNGLVPAAAIIKT
jgi:parallel beta-helix repeat protein